jgi:hypothetical protein
MIAKTFSCQKAIRLISAEIPRSMTAALPPGNPR